MIGPEVVSKSLVYVVPTEEVAGDVDPWQLLDAGQAIAIERLERVGMRTGVAYPSTSSVARALSATAWTLRVDRWQPLPGVGPRPRRLLTTVSGTTLE